MNVRIVGRQFWLWRAVDDEGEVLDLLVQRRRNKAAAEKLMRNLLKRQGFAPDVLVTDKLRSYGGKVRDRIVGAPLAGIASEQSGRELASADTTARAQDAAFQIARISPALPVHSSRRPKNFNVQRHFTSRRTLRVLRDEAFRTWRAAPPPEFEPGLLNFAAPIQVAVTRPRGGLTIPEPPTLPARGTAKPS